MYVMDSGSLMGDEWPPAPTFDSSLLSRRYSILLCVETGNPCEGKFNLEVPIQVLIRAAEDARTREERARPHSEARNFYEDNSLPSYAR